MSGEPAAGELVRQNVRVGARDEGPDVIMVIKMGSGSHLAKHAAHESINLFRADRNPNGGYPGDEEGASYPYYLYAPSDGIVGKGALEKDETVWCLFVGLACTNTYEVLGQARGVRALDVQKAWEGGREVPRGPEESLCKGEAVTYGGRPLSALTKDDEWPFLIGLKAQEVLLPAEDRQVFLALNEKARKELEPEGGVEDRCVVVLPEKTDKNGSPSTKWFNGSSQKLYFRPGSSDSEAYGSLLNCMRNEKLWSEGPADSATERACSQKGLDGAKPTANFLEVCGKEDDELAFSNALAYFMNRSEAVTKAFLERAHCGVPAGAGRATVDREKDHIDLLLTVPDPDGLDQAVIVENKTHSGLIVRDGKGVSGEREPQTHRYYKKVFEGLWKAEHDRRKELRKTEGSKDDVPDEEIAKDIEEAIHVVLLCPDYHPEINEIKRWDSWPDVVCKRNSATHPASYKPVVITYGELLQALRSAQGSVLASKDLDAVEKSLYGQLIVAVERHSASVDPTRRKDLEAQLLRRIAALTNGADGD